MSDTLKRSLHTAWQTFLAVFIAGLAGVVEAATTGGRVNVAAGGAALLALVAAAIAAGLSALKNVALSEGSRLR